VRQFIAIAIAINAIRMCALFGEPELSEDGEVGRATPFVQDEIRNARGKPLQARRPGDRLLENIVRTDDRYGHDGLFHGPRGKVYWDMLEHPRPIQNPNLWTDSQSAYFLADMTLPPACSLTLHSSYPHARYFQFALYKFKNNTCTFIYKALEGREIEPDQGSSNPLLFGANRLVETRRFTLRIVAKDAPQGSGTRAKNTLYAGRDGGQVEALNRLYPPDKGYDGRAGYRQGLGEIDRDAALVLRNTLTEADRSRCRIRTHPATARAETDHEQKRSSNRMAESAPDRCELRQHEASAVVGWFARRRSEPLSRNPMS
jgi:hypothetical protein